MTEGTNETSTRVEAARLANARHRAGGAAADDGLPTCPIAARVLHVDARGDLRGCRYGAEALRSSSGDVGDDWRAPELAALRDELARGELSSSHCGACIDRNSDSLLHRAPLVLDADASPQRASSATPTRLELSVPEPGAAATAQALLATADRAVVDATHATADETRALLERTRPAELELRVAPGAATPAWTELLQELRPQRVVVDLTCDTAAQLDALEQLGAVRGAAVAAHLTLRPDNWFALGRAAAVCSRGGFALAVRLAAPGGATPLAALCSEDLLFVHGCLAAELASQRDGTAWSDAIAEEVDGAVQEVRAWIERASRDDGEPAAAPELPPLQHDWYADADEGGWWVRALFDASHRQLIRDWLLDALQDDQRAACARHPWLRVLCQKVAWECHAAAALAFLREVYGPRDGRESLLAEDARFAERLGVEPYGGPWTALLNLDAAPRHKPFPAPGGATAAPGATPPRVTVLIPSYRHAPYIAEAIRSVLSQSLTALEVLVVDDRSPDDTARIARTFDDPRVTVRVNERNLGLGNSVLAALATIETPYVALLNSDDVFHPERLARCLGVLDREPAAQVVTTGLALIDGASDELTTKNVSLGLDGLQVYDWVNWYAAALPPPDLPQQRLFEELLARNFLATSSNLVARTDWLRARQSSFENLKYCLDWQIFLEAAADDALRHLHEPLAGYRLHASNTVWFDDGKRWAFYLETNRVLVEALQRLAARSDRLDEQQALRVARAIAEHIAANREADGLGLALNAVTDALALDRLAAGSEPLQAVLRDLHDRAHDLLEVRDQLEPGATAAHGRGARPALGQLLRERLRQQASSHTRRVAALETRIEELRRRCDHLLEQKQRLRGELDTTRRNLEERIQRANAARAKADDARQRAAEARQRAAEARQRADEARQKVQDELRQLRTRMAERQDRHDKAQAALQQQLDESRRELGERSGQLDRMTAAHRQLDASLQQLRQESAATKARLEERLRLLVNERNNKARELEALRHSREYRAGNFLWNKLPLSYMSRRAKKWYDRLFNAKNRVALWAEKKLRKPRDRGVAIVSATWQWPIYSHTFVYQEMVALTHMGLDVKLFHWKENDLDQLQPAFSYLKDNRVLIKPQLPRHRTDRDHFDKTRPGRLDELLRRIAPLTDKTVEELREDPQVLRACTFARLAELADARYLHSYFFYDQSFMTLITSWLLDLPRGVSCYADHMLQDYPYKLVALQVEMASVVVATSARIKQELVGIAGEQHADKIVVKPNGVNGERFPAIDRGARKPGEPFEVLSISRLEPKKGLEYLVEAVADLRDRGHDIVCHIIGAVDTSLQASIDYGAQLEDQIKTRGLQDAVKLHGMMLHEQIQPIMRRCRAFVAPYVELESGDKDGIPTAMLEALASGLPIVTTDSGSILEVVEDGVQALVTPQRDSAAYSDALERLIRDPALERKLAEAARARFDREFDIKVTEKRLHQRVAAALDGRPAAR